MESALVSNRGNRKNRRGGPDRSAHSECPPCGTSADCVISDDSVDFIDQTRAIWQKQTERHLTREDGREIVENMTGFFRILQEWDRAERSGQRTATQPPADGLKQTSDGDVSAKARAQL
jgi:hypothetical protein